MLNQSDILSRHPGTLSEFTDYWLNTRRQLLITYYQVVGIKPGKGTLSTLDETALDSFCQTLLDYLSSGHFNMYERIIRELADVTMSDNAAQIYAVLEANTCQIMHIYDTCLEPAINDDTCLAFQQALSETGEALEARFTLEDKLIQLASVHQQLTQDAANDCVVARPA